MFLVIDLNDNAYDLCVLAPEKDGSKSYWAPLRADRVLLWDSRNAAERAVRRLPKFNLAILEVVGDIENNETVLSRARTLFTIKD
jgi:hypothetical protein